MNAQKIIFIIIGAVFVVGIVLAAKFGNGFSDAAPQKTIDLPERNDTAPEVLSLHDYGTKIVYTTDTAINKSAYIDDCATRGGVFNVCGNTCAPDVATCSDVCALTCTTK